MYFYLHYTTVFIAQFSKTFSFHHMVLAIKTPNRNQCTHSKMEKICEICGKTFTRVSSLKRHVEAVHQNVEVQCEKCFQILITKNGETSTKMLCLPSVWCQLFKFL